VIFFWASLESQPHDPDVKVLLRIAVVRDVSVASNCAFAHSKLSSPLTSQPCERIFHDFTTYRERLKPQEGLSRGLATAHAGVARSERHHALSCTRTGKAPCWPWRC